jgi:hypothetical protein
MATLKNGAPQRLIFHKVPSIYGSGGYTFMQDLYHEQIGNKSFKFF